MKRTTVRLDDDLLRRAKKLAADQGKSLTALIEEGLRLLLANREAAESGRRKVVLPVSKAQGATLPGVDLDNSGALYDLLDTDVPPASARVAEEPSSPVRPESLRTRTCRK